MADTSSNADTTWRSTVQTTQLTPTTMSPSGSAISR